MVELSHKVSRMAARVVRWGDRNAPTGWRCVTDMPLVLGGLVGFLPVLGFWIIPAGLALIALDVPPCRQRVLAWLDRHAAA